MATMNQKQRTVWAVLVLLALLTPLTYVCQWLIFRPSWPNLALSVLIGTCTTLVGVFAALLVSPYGAADRERLSKVSATIFTLVTGYVLAKIIDPLVTQIIGNGTAVLSVAKGANFLIAMIGFLAGFLGTYVFRAYLGGNVFRNHLSIDRESDGLVNPDTKAEALPARKAGENDQTDEA